MRPPCASPRSRARSLDDVAPKTLLAAWMRWWGGDTHVATMIEAAITADMAATTPEFLAPDGDHG